MPCLPLPRLAAAAALALLTACSGGDGSSSSSAGGNALVVNSLLDSASPPAGTVTLRSALAQASSGQTIRFDRSLDGGTLAVNTPAPWTLGTNGTLDFRNSGGR